MREHGGDAGLRRHRPRRPFRFEYLRGKFSGLTRREREERFLDDELDERLSYLDLLDRLKRASEAESEGPPRLHPGGD
jgi:hypothetical protein